MARRNFIAGNWKMNKTAAAAVALAKTLRDKLEDCTGVDIAVCPVYTVLGNVAEVLQGSCIKVGAQNVHWAETGAFTGEISAEMLKEIPVEYVIIGHSERRQYFGENDETVNKRLRRALQAGLKPIVCVGETLDQRETGETERVVERQVVDGLAGMNAQDMATVTLAYDPVWAIGTGRTATPAQAENVHLFIRGLLAKLFGRECAEAVRIQYGGSVKADNASELLSQPNIDGALVGGASLNADDFAAIVVAAL